MEHAQKRKKEKKREKILIDSRVLDTLQQFRPPISDAMSDSLRTMQDILVKTGANLEDKANFHQQTLWQYLTCFDSYKEKSMGTVRVRPDETVKAPESGALEKAEFSTMEQGVLPSVPKSTKGKAERWLQRI